jgi:hypothetical protein
MFGRFWRKRMTPTGLEPPPCPACDGRLRVEPWGAPFTDRYVCQSCACDFEAIQDASGDYQINREPMRYKARRGVLARSA